MIKVLTIIGARPQIIKAAAISRAIKNHFSDKIREVIVHTGQHYDDNMSKIFFDELGVPKDDYNLGVGSGNHGKQTAQMIEGIEKILLEEKPNCLIVYGDTNSTLAGAIAASKIHIPIVHIEAGLRSYNKRMPEEINRICCDHVSTLLFSPTKSGVANLAKEGFNIDAKAPYHIDNPKVYHCGDIMYDNSLYFSDVAQKKSKIVDQSGVAGQRFVLVTVHRDTNTDQPERLNALFEAFNEISVAERIHFVIPLHPRTSKVLDQRLKPELLKAIRSNSLIHIIPPAGFIDIIKLESSCALVMTDSGGVQKEAFFFHKPIIILRSETEWIELVQNGNAILADTDKQQIKDAYETLMNKKDYQYPPIFGDGKAAEFICSEIYNQFS
jgi:UDP-GlcNAc3NAcA epimerase